MCLRVLVPVALLLVVPVPSALSLVPSAGRLLALVAAVYAYQKQDIVSPTTRKCDRRPIRANGWIIAGTYF